jgi:hypothetical protein|nr:MAG TPA: Helix-turn-helix XRE-family like protein [Caudoviricetes sp.]
MKLNAMEVKVLLVEHNLNQAELAEKAGLSRITITSLMTGKNGSAESLNKIAKALNVPVRQIITVD